MIIHECEQGTEQWFDVKRGKVSASEFSKVLNKGTGRGLYMRKLAGEKLTGLTENGYTNNFVEAGNKKEQAAREYYESVNNLGIRQVGFVEKDEDTGASPDGLVGEKGGVEIKCPIPSTHINNIIKDKMPTLYIPQVQGQLWVTEREWWDWVSYCPEIGKRPYFYKRIYRDEAYIRSLETAIGKFVSELKEIMMEFENPIF